MPSRQPARCRRYQGLLTTLILWKIFATLLLWALGVLGTLPRFTLRAPT